MDLSEGGTVICQDLSAIQNVCGLALHGIIGTSSLKRLIVQLDFDGGRLRVLDPLTHGNKSDWGECIPISFERGGLPFVYASPSGRQDLFLVDTGYTGVAFFDHLLVKELEATGAISSVRHGIHRSLSGDLESTIYKLDSTAIGTLQCRGLFVNGSALNCLGMSFFRRFNVTFDFGHGALYLKKSRQFDEGDRIDRSGLALLLHDGRTVVYSVYAGSPAARRRDSSPRRRRAHERGRIPHLSIFLISAGC